MWIDGLEATKKEYDKISETWSTVPDWKERRENANTIVAYMEGRPIERQMVLGGSFDGFGKMIAKMQGSPEALRVLRSMTGELPALDGVQETAEETELPNTREN